MDFLNQKLLINEDGICEIVSLPENFVKYLKNNFSDNFLNECNQWLNCLYKKRKNHIKKIIKLRKGTHRDTQKINEWKQSIIELCCKHSYPIRCDITGEELFVIYQNPNNETNGRVYQPNFDFHHLNSVDKFPDQKYEPSNGVIVLRAIHKLFHKIYGQGNNTKEQYNEFKNKYNKEQLK